MRILRITRAFFLLSLVFVLFAGCSSRFDPLLPEESQPDDPVIAPRGAMSFEELLKASDHDNYTEISGVVDTANGGIVQGTVSGYDSAFRLDVPPGACPSLCNLRILVPNEGVPVYQLLPHMNFNSELTVTLDYSKWLDEGSIAPGSPCEIFYMNEESGAFERLAPRVRFTADPSNPSVSFTTDHFSRWWIGEGD